MLKVKMMKNLKILGMFLISLFFVSLLFSVCSVDATTDERFTAEEKLPALLSDVIGIDLSKYNKVEDHSYYVRQYEYGGSVEVERCGFWLIDSKGDTVTINSEFHNGFPFWIYISPMGCSLHYTSAPLKGSVKDLRDVFERYMDFAQKYGISTIDRSSALELFSRAPSNLPASDLSPVVVASDDLALALSKKSFGFCRIVNGVELPNKSVGLYFTDDVIDFSDTFGLYDVCDVNIFSSDAEFADFAFEVANVFCESFFAPAEENFVRPDLLRSRFEVGLVMIPGQIYNNPLNDELLEAGLGTRYSVDRDASVLYPLWTAKFYFSETVGNVDGVQVGVWGDTGEVAYCWETGHLGGGMLPSNGSSSAGSTTSSGDLVVLAVIAVIVLIVAAITVTFVKKKHK
jgi:hypothetical protein